MSSNRTALFKLSQAAKRLIAISPANKRTAIKNIWVEAETNASFKPKKSDSGRAVGALNDGDHRN